MTKERLLFWQQGRLLDTQETRRWPTDLRAKADVEERRRIFINFYSEDDGRSRLIIGVCATPDDAASIVAAHNSALRAALEQKGDVDDLQAAVDTLSE